MFPPWGPTADAVGIFVVTGESMWFENFQGSSAPLLNEHLSLYFSIIQRILIDISHTKRYSVIEHGIGLPCENRICLDDECRRPVLNGAEGISADARRHGVNISGKRTVFRQNSGKRKHRRRNLPSKAGNLSGYCTEPGKGLFLLPAACSVFLYSKAAGSTKQNRRGSA